MKAMKAMKKMTDPNRDEPVRADGMADTQFCEWAKAEVEARIGAMKAMKVMKKKAAMKGMRKKAAMQAMKTINKQTAMKAMKKKAAMKKTANEDMKAMKNKKTLKAIKRRTTYLLPHIKTMEKTMKAMEDMMDNILSNTDRLFNQIQRMDIDIGCISHAVRKHSQELLPREKRSSSSSGGSIYMVVVVV